jgi:probable 2-oxoglutarate dehydrogenase E1 component DHKTD1
VASYVPPPLTFQAEWAGMVWPANEEARHDPETGVDRTVLERVGRASIAVPEGFVSFIPWTMISEDYSIEFATCL